MSYTLLDIANSAIIKVGAKPLQSLNDDTPSGRVVALRLRPVMDTVLSLYPFNCTLRRTVLAPQEHAVLPVKYPFTYETPADMFQLVRLEDKTGDMITDYEHYGQQIQCSHTPLVVIYSRSLYNISSIDYEVAELVSLYLAYDICERIDPNYQRRQQLYQEFQIMFAQVRTSDSRRNGPSSYGPIDVFGPRLNRFDRPNDWIDSRK